MYQHIKLNNILEISYTIIKWDLLQWRNDGSTFTKQYIKNQMNKTKNKNHNHLNEYRKSIWQNLISFNETSCQQTGCGGKNASTQEDNIWQAHRVNTILKSEKLKVSPQRQGTRQGCQSQNFDSIQCWKLRTKRLGKQLK